MARTISWLSLLPSMTRAVEASPQSHYSRKDLQKLFEVQARSAQNLMGLMATVTVGTSHLVEREVLLSFLRRIAASRRPAEAYAALQAVPPKPSRRKLRALSFGDAVSDPRSSPPSHMTIQRGEVKITFLNLEELAEAMVYLARNLQENLEHFAEQYEPAQNTV